MGHLRPGRPLGLLSLLLVGWAACQPQPIRLPVASPTSPVPPRPPEPALRDPAPRAPEPVLAAAPAPSTAPQPPAAAPTPTEAAPTTPPAPPPTETGRRIWTQHLDGHGDFLRFSAPVRGIPFTKFVIRPESGTVYYFWTSIYPFHYDFVTKVLLLRYRPEPSVDAPPAGPQDDPTWSRPFILGAIGYQNGVHGYEFQEKETPSPEVLRYAHQRLRETFTGVDLRFRPISAKQRQLLTQVPEIPWINADFVDEHATFQCLHEGRAVGRLRRVLPTEDAAKLSFSPLDILLLDEIPQDIAPVAGILASRLSSPLSHVNLRATAWGIPNGGLTTAHQLADPLIGQIVHYEVRPAGVTLRLATPAERKEYEQLQRRTRTVPLQVPAGDLQYRGLPELEGLTAEDVVRVGAKAANLGVLATQGSGKHFRVPPGLVVPFIYYQEHLLTHGLHLALKRILDQWQRTHDEPALREALQALQGQIRREPLHPNLREQLLLRVHHLLGRRGFFVRSSTNAEDLPGFNGAGLYDTVPNVQDDEALVEAIKQVWASVWNLRAFRERERFGIDHRAVFAAVIIQVGIDAEAAGVLITRDVFRPQATTGITINAKRGLGIRVVDGQRVPEQVLYDEEHDELRIISRSADDRMLRFDEQGGVREVAVEQPSRPVLSEALVRRLVAAAQEARTLFPRTTPLDIEWLVVGETVYLVQSRPYVEGVAP